MCKRSALFSESAMNGVIKSRKKVAKNVLFAVSDLKKIALRAVVGSLNPQEPGQLLVGSSKRKSGSIFGVSVWRGSVVAWQSSSPNDWS
jgi:hypothetical protein